LIKRGF